MQRNATITSPVTGYVVNRNYDAGAIPGDLPVVVVADMRQMELESAWTALESSAEVVVTQEKALDLARESVSIAQVSYENGVLTSSELNDAQVRLLQTEYLLMQAKYARITAAARAKVAAGFSS